MSEVRKGPFTYPYPMFGATATMLLYASNADGTPKKFLMGRRAGNANAFPMYLCVPGGFVDEGQEEVEDAAVREIKEETNLDIGKYDLEVVYVASDPKADPRCHVVNTVFAVDLGKAENMWKAMPGDDLIELEWINVEDWRHDEEIEREIHRKNGKEHYSGFAFNHEKLIRRTLEILETRMDFWTRLRYRCNRIMGRNITRRGTLYFEFLGM